MVASTSYDVVTLLSVSLFLNTNDSVGNTFLPSWVEPLLNTNIHELFCRIFFFVKYYVMCLLCHPVAAKPFVI